MRKIDTEAGVLVGKADRIARTVAWHLECPECAELIPLSEEALHGQRAAVCECGWKTAPIGTLAESGPNGIYVYYDFAEGAFGGTKVTGVHAGGLERGMRL